MAQNSTKTTEEKNLKVEILEQIAKLATAGFGLVAALAWNSAIQELFTKLFPTPAGSLTALFLYAVVITLIVVAITIYLGKAVNRAKELLKEEE